MMQWFRLYSRMVDDDKLKLLAFEDRWHFVALCCLKSEGLLDEAAGDLRDRRIAVRLGVQLRELEEIGRRLREVELVDEALSPLAWDDLQFRSDKSTERVREFRKRQRNQRGNAVKRDETVSVTAQETETDTEVISPNGDSPSGDGLKVEHVFEAYQDMAREIGLPVPRDLTPERRQLIRGRIAQYPLADFLAAFAKCRGSPFLRGDRNGRTPLSIDWLMKKGNFQKTLEGNYDR